jgi:signal transduction histidine kinase
MVASVAARCATGQRSWFNDLHPKWIARLIPLGVGLACFMITELMHYLLVSDLGRRKERWLAEAVSAFLVSVLVAKVAAVVHRQYQVMLARTQVISEMNHHIRNALMAISASAYLSQNQECIRTISESVYRIDWALREILPRMQPLPEVERSRLMFLVPRSSSASRENDNLDLSLSFGEGK